MRCRCRGSADRNDLRAVRLLGHETHFARGKVDILPTQEGDVAQPCAGVGGGQNHAAPLGVADGENCLQLVWGERAPLRFVRRIVLEARHPRGLVDIDKTVVERATQSRLDRGEGHVDGRRRVLACQKITMVNDVNG